MKKIVLLLAMFTTIIACNAPQKIMKVLVSNTQNMDREMETVIVQIKEVFSKLGNVDLDKIVVLNEEDGITVPAQIVVSPIGDTALIFQTQLNANAKKTYQIKQAKEKPNYTSQVYGRFVPERKDDYAWENNKIAFRMYGPALQQTGEISTGIDVWAKKTDSLVIDKWYKSEDYHVDYGQGLDCYKVGPTLGAGAPAFVVNHKAHLAANNFTKYEVLANGPIRTMVKLTYAPYLVGKDTIEEIRYVSLDANVQFNHIDMFTYSNHNQSIDLPAFAAGLVHRKETAPQTAQTKNSLSYYEPAIDTNGYIGVAVIYPHDSIVKVINDGAEFLAVSADNTKDKTIFHKRYYQGAGWSKAGFPDAQSWFKYTQKIAQQINTPLQVVIVE